MSLRAVQLQVRRTHVGLAVWRTGVVLLELYLAMVIAIVVDLHSLHADIKEAMSESLKANNPLETGYYCI